MSYCQIIEFRDGKPSGSIKFQNSWGGAAFIWGALYSKYLKDPEKEYDTWLGCSTSGDRRLWDLSKRSDVPMFMRAVHASTFDRAIVRREHFAQFARHLQEFVEYFGTQGKECHLPGWSYHVENSQAEAIGFYGTSVSENLWYESNEETGEDLPYDLNARSDHFEVYDWLNSIDQRRDYESQ